MAQCHDRSIIGGAEEAAISSSIVTGDRRPRLHGRKGRSGRGEAGSEVGQTDEGEAGDGGEDDDACGQCSSQDMWHD
jgi:hypothetical protein